MEDGVGLEGPEQADYIDAIEEMGEAFSLIARTLDGYIKEDDVFQGDDEKTETLYALTSLARCKAHQCRQLIRD